MRRHGRFHQHQAAHESNGINWLAVGAVAAALALLLPRSRTATTPTPAWPFRGQDRLLPGHGNNINNTKPTQPWSSPFPASQSSGKGKAKAPTNWLPWVLGGGALYGGKKLLDYLATVEAPIPAPPRPAQIEGSLSSLLANLALLPPTPVAAPRTETPLPIWTPPVDARWLSLAPHPSVVLVLGKRGSGKSALGYRLLELFKDHAAPYVVGLPAAARKLLPDWVGYADRLDDVPPKAVVLLDESYIRYHARDSMGAEGRTIGQMVNLSRQKEQSLIFIVQEGRQLDVNAISQADVIAVKELSEISREFERRELKRFTDKARAAFVGVKGNRQRQTWVYSEAAGEVGLVENELASFWKPALSRAFAHAPDQTTNGAEGQRKGARTSREELKARARALRQQEHSFRDIGKILGISKTHAFNLVTEPDSAT